MAMEPTPSSRVNVPAIGLMVTGGLGILTGLGWLAILAIGGVAALADQDAADALGGIGVLVALGVVGVLVSAFVTYAGLQMRALQGWGVSMAGAILAMIPCGPCCLVGLPFGIWAILVLIDEEVKRAFGARAETPDGADLSPPSPRDPPADAPRL